MSNMVEEVFFLNEENTNMIKQRIVKILYKKNISQSKIADLLNISQPMVSNYCKSDKKTNREVVRIAKKISDKIVNENKINFQTCISFTKKPLEGHFFVVDKNEILTDENSKLMENLKNAFYNLKERNLSGFVPKIKVNIAMSKENPRNSNDVASFLDGLIIVDNKITGYNGIRFGKSKHLSSILINHGQNLDVNAIMNIAYNKKLEKTGFKIGFLNKNFNLEEQDKNFDILVHKGDFGIEPCAYILGKDALELSDKLLKIIGERNNEK